VFDRIVPGPFACKENSDGNDLGPFACKENSDGNEVLDRIVPGTICV
jgi:hypothetical protein